jgi:raffinose/stachyose/melibiose transport system permease protein
MMNHRKGYWPFLAPGLLLCTLVVAVPLVMTFGTSFTQWSGVGSPHWTGLANYDRLLHDDRFWKSFENIAFMVIAMAVVPTLLGLFLAALLFDYVAPRLGGRTARVLRSGFYLPQVLPLAITGIIWGWILHPNYGVLNSILDKIGLGALARNWLGDEHYALYTVMAVMIWVQIGYPVVMFMAGLQRVDPELYEAAALDGAGWWKRFTRIALYQIRPEIGVVLITTTIAALKVFAQIFVLTGGGPGNATLVPSYFAWQNYFQNANVGYASAISTVQALLIVGLTFAFIRVQSR